MFSLVLRSHSNEDRRKGFNASAKEVSNGQEKAASRLQAA
jgi:hypothetical protein